MTRMKRFFDSWNEPLSAMGIELFSCGEVSKSEPDSIIDGWARNYALIFVKQEANIARTETGPHQ